MKFKVKKTENCFSNTQTYEYSLPVSNQELMKFLTLFSIKEFTALRRPTFLATDAGGVQIKGIIKDNICKVSFPDLTWETSKMEFESFIDLLKEE